MRNLILFLALTIVAASIPLEAQSGRVYLRSNASRPWNVTNNEEDMNIVFGAGNWLDARYETVNVSTLFSPSTTFIYMEGGDYSANALRNFLDLNRAALEAWVQAGGRLLVNAAPNEGENMTLPFGVTLHFTPNDYSSASTSALIIPGNETKINQPTGPVGPSFENGNNFSHAYVTGGAGLTGIIQDSSNRFVLAEQRSGSGIVLYGGMTADVFQNPQPNTQNLRCNVIYYTNMVPLEQ